MSDETESTTIPNTSEEVRSGFGEEMTGSGFELVYPVDDGTDEEGSQEEQPGEQAPPEQQPKQEEQS